MTKYEAYDLTLQSIASYTSTLEMLYLLITIYVTFVFAYLAAAFVAGQRLTSLQAAIGSMLFLTASGGIAWQITQTLGGLQAISYGISKFARMAGEHEEAQGWIANHSGLGFFIVEHLIILVLVIGIMASLYFMWSVRHPKAS